MFRIEKEACVISFPVLVFEVFCFTSFSLSYYTFIGQFDIKTSPSHYFFFFADMILYTQKHMQKYRLSRKSVQELKYCASDKE